jgi:hypothetical protein
MPIDDNDLPLNANVFSSLTTDYLAFESAEVVDQLETVLKSLHRALQNAHKDHPIDHHLSRVNLVQLEDKSALLEWNFQDFRVGISLEPNRAESSYYIVSQDKSTGALMTDTQKLDHGFSTPVNKMVRFVLGHS